MMFKVFTSVIVQILKGLALGNLNFYYFTNQWNNKLITKLVYTALVHMQSTHLHIMGERKKKKEQNYNSNLELRGTARNSLSFSWLLYYQR